MSGLHMAELRLRKGVMMAEQLKDSFGRTISYMRISLTKECNLRCSYCRPRRTLPGADAWQRENVLTIPELVRVVQTAAAMGISRYRLTGGEPLLRRGCAELVHEMKQVPGVETVCLTTNGTLLAPLAGTFARAGLDGVTVSLDTIDPRQYTELTGGGHLNRVLDGIREAERAGLWVKINAVNRGEGDLLPLVSWCEEQGLLLRVIELMPIGIGKTYPAGPHRSNDELLAQLTGIYGNSEQLSQVPGQGSGPAVYYGFAKKKEPVGFISAVSHEFCGSCSRVRLTSEGFLKPCLCYDTGTDLRRILRLPDPGETLEAAIREAVWKKPRAHCFSRPQEITERRDMSGIGG